MKRLVLPAVLVLLMAAGSCRPRAGAVRTAASKPTPHPVAVLLFEDNLDFAATESFAGGRALYRDEVEGLAHRLREQGVAATALPVPVEGFTDADLAPFAEVVIADTFVITPAARTVLEDYVRAGGTLVGLCEVGRFPGEWAKPWPFGALFGLETRVTDPWQTGVANGPAGFYRYADVRAPGSDLLRGLTNRIDWGPVAQHVWATDPAGAEVLATFPRYISTVDEKAGPVVVTNEVPAVTDHRYGKGRAIFVSVLPTARIFDGWKNAPDALRLIANAAAGAQRPVGLPAAPPLQVTVGWNQIGYAPDWPKRIVLRVRGGDTNAPLSGTFRAQADDGTTAGEGALQVWPGALWRTRFLYADLAGLTNAGDYTIHLAVADGYATGIALRVTTDLLTHTLPDAEKSFFDGMRCGETCHRSDPVPGAYHDASGDWGLRMWSLPHVAWALARFVEEHPEDERFRFELDRTAMWLWQMQGPDGAPYAGIHSPTDTSPIDVRPKDDPTQREIDKRYSFEYTATYAAALARAIKPVRERVSLNLAQEIQMSAERAFLRIQNEQVEATKDLGNRLWAATELYRATRIDDYLKAAERDARRILPRQLGQGRVVDGDVYGDFFADPSDTTFSPQQWKRFHSIGIYLGLVELSRELPPGEMKTDVEVVLDRFAQGFLLGMSSLTPYGQMGLALEPAAPAKPRPDGRGFLPPEQFKVYHFSHREAWVRDHGLNCDLLAMATVALERYRDTGDERLRAMAERQISWVLGANPLGYCMLDGYGTNPAPGIDPDLGTGPIRGAIPNGIIGRGEANIPVWGTTWDSREYWLPHNAYLLAALASMTP